MRALGFVIGVAVVALTATSLFTTLVVPRATSSRLLRTIAIVLARLLRFPMRHLRTYAAKDRLMAVVGPFSMILLFVVWLVLLVIGFGLISWLVDGSSLGSAMGVAGSSVFTLGFAKGHGPVSQPVEFVAAGMGLLVIALEIAYLPTLYSAFSSREAVVTMLSSRPRAGVPAWGPEVLARHHWFRTEDELAGLYASWESWAAAVAESHASYPTLMWFRSPDSRRSWLLSLTAILDAAALHDSTRPTTCPRQARVMLSMGIECLRSLAKALRIAFDEDPKPDQGLRLTKEEFDEGCRRLEEVGYEFERPPDQAWPHFQGWRVNYEGLVDRLTELLMPPPAPWLLPRPALGTVHWPDVIDRTPEHPEGDRGRRPPRRGGQADDGSPAGRGASAPLAEVNEPGRAEP